MVQLFKKFNNERERIFEEDMNSINRSEIINLPSFLQTHCFIETHILFIPKH